MRNGTRLAADRRGATAAIFAIAMPVLVGMGALAIDVGIWNVQKRQAQGAADQAAFSAAVAAKAGNTSANAEMNARAITAGMGFVHGENGVAVTVTNPPAAGQFAGKSGYWEVTVTEPQATWLAGYLLGGEANVRARAVAGGSAGGNACIIALSSSGNALSFGNNTEILNPNCAIYSNSTSQTSLYCGTSNGAGAPDIYAATYVAGNAATNCEFSPGRDARLHINQPAVADPYADVTTSLPPSCSVTAPVTGGTVGPATPGGTMRLCGGINIAKGTLTLQRGTYYVDSIFTSVSSGAILDATAGVTLILSSGVEIKPGNGTTLNIEAPATGPFAGIAMMSRATSPTKHLVDANNLNFNIMGALYFPNQDLDLKNNFDTTKCAQLVARTIAIKNNANMFHDCPGTGIRSPGNSSIALME